MHRSIRQFARLLVMSIGLWDLSAAHAQADAVTRGSYLARLGDCAACHTTQGGQPYAGGRIIATPFGTIPSPNLTPDHATGIGDWSADDFYRAMHEGIGHDGQKLYPAFPYTSFTRMTRTDVDAIYAYLRSLPAVSRPNDPAELRFPYSMRGLLGPWRGFYFDAGEFKPNPRKSAAWNRGAYLVQGPGHCNECHAARNQLGAMTEPYLGGGIIPMQDWYAPDLATATHGGLAGWSQADIVQLLSTGASRHGTAIGPMAEVVEGSTMALSDEDARAIATFLASLPARAAPEKHDALPIPADKLDRGGTIYAQQCADCHGKDGAGKAGRYPALAGNTTVLDPTGINVTRALMLGGFAPTTKATPEPYSMPPFGERLNDADAAAVLTYIRQSFGNAASEIRDDDVRHRRAVPAY